MKLKLKNREGFVFDEGSHTYQLNGQLLTGVTTILNVRAKDFLKWWTVKLMFETLAPKLKEVQGITQEMWIQILGEAKQAHRTKTKEALNSGTVAHDAIEAYIKDRIAGIEQPITAEIKDEMAKASFAAFREWERANSVEWLASEIQLASVVNMVGGTVDAVARINGVLTVLDFKTSNQISEDVALQTAAYLILLEENLDDDTEKPQQRAVLRIPKDGGAFEYQRIDSDLAFDKKTFINLRECHRWNVYIKNNFTEGGEYDRKIKLQK